MTNFTIRDEDNIDIVLGGSNLSAQIATSILAISIDGHKKLELGIELNDRPVSSVVTPTEALSARVLKITLTASENISALKMIYMTGPTSGGLGDTTDLNKFDVIGIALTAAVVGNIFEVLLFGRVEDGFFNYPVNTSLYLDISGNITSIAPSTGYSVLIGKGLGTGAIFIDIERPIIL